MDLLRYIQDASLTTILIGLIILAVVCMKIFFDIKETVSSRNLYRKLVAKGRKVNQRSASVIIELNQRAETIMPLIKHLYNQKYSKLEVIVIVKQTAGAKAQSRLVSFRRKHHLKNLRIIKHKKGLTVSAVVDKYASGAFIIQLLTGDRLSKNFFSNLSLDALDLDSAVIIPRQQLRLSNNLSRALRVHINVWQNLLSRLKPSDAPRKLASGIVYQKKSLTSDRNTKITTKTSNRLYVMRQLSVPQISHPWKERSIFLTTTSVIVGLIVLLLLADASERVILIIFLAGLYVVTYSVFQLSLKGYSWLDKLSLVLLAPLGLLNSIFIMLIGLQRNLSKWPNNLLQKHS